MDMGGVPLSEFTKPRQGQLKGEWEFGTTEQRNALRIIDIYVDDRLISRGDVFTEYISHGTNGEFDIDRLAGNKIDLFGHEN